MDRIHSAARLAAFAVLGGAALCSSVSSACPSQEPTTARPVVPAGFTVDLICEAPDLRWPSAVHCLADGSLLVAEDPMDMPGPPDEPIDRIWRFVVAEDGSYERTLFAEGLYAVFGLQEIDGAVYVMNMPELTVLRDADGDGIAEERTVLIDDLGPPAPGHPGGFNDHIVSGIRLGMDGDLYISVGDKGVPHAEGTDGSTISLRGGGVVRVHPDGSDLEIVARGTRNHLDVAMNRHDHIFTHDNTDDGLGWWTRVTHILPTGDYGYPWKYHDHQDRMLAPMKDFGGGSPCGGLCYEEGAWPPEYVGNLFFCEWGDGVLRRFVVESTGAEYRLVADENFMTGGDVREFRPLDICESPDGRDLYVADWGYGGWRTEDVTGRLWRVRARDLREVPPLDLRTVDGCFEALHHPGLRSRMLAQRALAAMGAEVIDPLAYLLTSDASADARRHAVWALAAIGEQPAFEAIASVLRPTTQTPAHQSADTRAEAARALGRFRIPAVHELLEALNDPESMVVREAAIALGRLADPLAAGPLIDVLIQTSDSFVEFAARQALRRVGASEPGAWRVLVQMIATSSDDELAHRCLQVFLEIQDRGAVDALSEGVADPSMSTPRRVEALAVLAEAHRQSDDWDGKWWGTQPARTDPPAKVLPWDGTQTVVDSVGRMMEDDHPQMRAAACNAVRSMQEHSLLPRMRRLLVDEVDGEVFDAALAAVRALHDQESVPLLRSALRRRELPESSRVQIVETAGSLAGPAAQQWLVQLLGDPALGEPLTLAALVALRTAGDENAADAVERVSNRASVVVRVAALETLGALLGESAQPTLVARLADPDSVVRRAAARLLGPVANEAGTRALLTALASATDTEERESYVRALCAQPRAAALPAYLEGLADRSPALRNACRSALRPLRAEVTDEVNELALTRNLPFGSLPELQLLFSEPRPIADWELLGPLDEDRFLDTLPGSDGTEEHFVDSSETFSFRAHHTDDENGFVDLEPLFTPHTQVCAYARATVLTWRERPAEMWIGSDDSVRVWLNGTLVHEYPGDRGWTADQDRFRVRLRAGTNQVLLRIGQKGGQWSFNAKISPEGSGPLFEPGPESGEPRTLEDQRAFALANPGRALNGQRIFFDESGPACFRCHRLNGQGELVGPDLSSIGSRYARAELITHVLEPSQQIHDGFQTTVLFLKSGLSLEGMVTKETAETITLVDREATAHDVAVRDIESRKTSQLSAMPDGQVSGLTLEEFADLVAYLEGLREVPAETGSQGQ